MIIADKTTRRHRRKVLGMWIHGRQWEGKIAAGKRIARD
jgi:hypothetical protein